MTENCSTAGTELLERHAVSSNDLARVAGILVDHLVEAGVDLHVGPSLDETKRMLVDLLRKARPSE